MKSQIANPSTTHNYPILSLDAYGRSVGQEIWCRLCSPKFHYHSVQFTSSHPVFLKMHFNIILHLYLGFPTSVFASGFSILISQCVLHAQSISFTSLWSPWWHLANGSNYEAPHHATSFVLGPTSSLHSVPLIVRGQVYTLTKRPLKLQFCTL